MLEKTKRLPDGGAALRRLALCAVAVVSLLAACTDARVTAPATPPATPPAAPSAQVLGLVEVTFSGIGTQAMQATVRPVGPAATPGGHPTGTAQGLHLDLTSVPGGDGSIELEPVSTGSFTTGARGVDGERYLYATFQVRNAQSDSTAYTTPRTNLTFLAVSTAGTLGETPVSALARFDGDPADPAIAAELLPTGQVRQTTSSAIVSTGPDVFQAYEETQVASLTVPPAVTDVFPYGFVVRNPGTSTSRTLAANPAAGQFDGVVTFAYKVPLQATAAQDPFTISAVFVAVDDDQTTITQSVEEQDATAQAAFEARVTALGATAVTLLPGGAYTGGAAIQRLCTVRTAGPAGAPLAVLVPPAASLLSLSPDPFASDGSGSFIPAASQIAAQFIKPASGASSSTFVVHGSQSGRAFVSGSYTGDGTTTITTPSGAFFPGEEVEVSLTSGISPCGDTHVAQYHVAASSAAATFTEAAGSPVDVGTGPVSVAAADFDGDGDVDLATADSVSGQVAVRLNTGSGAFTNGASVTSLPAVTSLVAGDLDGDGDVDLAVASAVTLDEHVFILTNDGAAGFTNAGTTSVGNTPVFISAADVTGDGSVDLAVANQNSDNVSILRNDGTAGFPSPVTVPAGDSPRSVAAADLDGDGDLDLAVTSPFGIDGVVILVNDGTGTFTADPLVPIPGPADNAVSIAAGDMDGDGDPDLVVSANNGGGGTNSTMVLLRNDGTGAFTFSETVLSTTGNPIAVILADADGDGDLDVVGVNQSGDQAFLLPNDGTGTLGTIATFAVGTDPVSLAAADLNGDGTLDLAVANTSSNNISILLNQ